MTLDLSKAFDTIDIHILQDKVTIHHNTGIIIKYISNYIKGRQRYTTYTNIKSKTRNFHCDIPQGGVLSPTLFNIYMSDLPQATTPNAKYQYLCR